MASNALVGVWDPPDPLGPDEAIPLLEGRRLQMYKALVENDSYYELSLLFPSLAADLAGMGYMKAASGAGIKMRTDRTIHNRAMFVLLHSIPKDLLRSLILGTVAFEAQRLAPRLPCYNAEGPGAYAATMAIEGRNDAFKAWKIHRGNPQSASHKILRDFAEDVDNQYGKRDANKPNELRFIRESSVWKVEALIQSLERRCHTSISGSDMTRQVASPLYVGCSKNIVTRAPAYQPRNGLKNANKLWGLVCCLLNSMGKPPSVNVVPIIRTWNRTDLPLAEVLVTMLGNSLVCQDGFNGHGPGTATDGGTVDVLKHAERVVLIYKPYLKINIEATKKEMERREEYLEDCEIVAGFPDAEAQDLIERVDEKYQDLLEAIDLWEARFKNLMVVRDVLQNKVAAAQKYVEYLRNVKSVLGAVTSVLDQPEQAPRTDDDADMGDDDHDDHDHDHDHDDHVDSDDYDTEGDDDEYEVVSNAPSVDLGNY
ncbi:hypothetical protein Hte_009623 [Hypoxylon texense]